MAAMREGTYFRQWRRSQFPGISQNDAATAAEISRTQITEWELGRRDMPLEAVLKLARCYRLPAMKLLSSDQIELCKLVRKAMVTR